MLNVEKLDEQTLKNILESKTSFSLIYETPPKDEKIWSELNEKVFKVRKDIGLRIGLITGGPEWHNISFLKYLDEVEKLNINDFSIQSLEPITYLKDLKHLTIRSNSDTLKYLEKFKNLEVLKVTWVEKDIEVISGFSKLKELYLSAISIYSLDFLKSLRYLEKLYFFELDPIPVSILNILPEIGRINTLGLNTMNLQNIDFVTQMPYLKQLWLDVLPIKSLPKFPETSPLEIIEISYLDNLKDIMGLSYLKQLENLDIFNTSEGFDRKILEQQKKKLEKMMNRHL